MAELDLGRRPIVALLENHSETRQYIRAALSDYAVDVVEFASAQELFDSRIQADAFVLDINLGSGREQEGLDVLERLRSSPREVPIAIYSSYADLYARAADNFGVTVRVVKSADLLLDVERIVTAIDPHRLYLDLEFASDPAVLHFVNSSLREGRFSSRDLRKGLREFAAGGVFDPGGASLNPNSAEGKQIITDVVRANQAVLSAVRRDPALLWSITPRQFEEMVAELLGILGYDVLLTPATRDGGYDIRAARNDALGTFVYLVECKRYAPTRKVGIEPVGRLHGTVQRNQATAGAIITTSSFTADALNFQKPIAHQLQLRDYVELQRMLRLI